MTQPTAVDCSRFANAIDVTTLKSGDPGGVSSFTVGMERRTCVTRCRPRDVTLRTGKLIGACLGTRDREFLSHTATALRCIKEFDYPPQFITLRSPTLTGQ